MDQRGQILTVTAGYSVFSPTKEGHMLVDVKPPIPVPKKNTVKELLRKRRQNCIFVHELKVAKHEVVSPDASPHMPSPPAPVIQSTTVDVAVLKDDYVVQEPAQSPQDALSPELKMSLFHWQIQQEAQRLEGLTAEHLNMQDADGDTFLHIAVAQGKRALAYVLAQKMAQCGSLDIEEHNNQTPLHIAVATDQHLIVSDLLSHGAQISVRDQWGNCTLHVCAEKGHFRSLQSICRALVKNERDYGCVELYNYDGFTPIHIAVLAHNAIVKEMRSLQNPCAFMMSRLANKKRTYVETIKVLMYMGVAYAAKDRKSGRTCLHMAAEEANLELLNLFLEQRTSTVNVNLKTYSGNTPLHVVSSLQNSKTQVEAVKLLMRKGADPGMRNYENELPCQLVPEGCMGEKVRQILKGKNIHV